MEVQDVAPPVTDETPTTTTTTTTTTTNLQSPPETKRKRQPRNSACQPCASLKMKCVPSGEPGRCDRCHRMSKECIAPIPKPRKRRTESGVGGNETHSSLLDLESTPADAHLKATPADAHLKATPPKQAPLGPSATIPIASLLSRSDIRDKDSNSFSALFGRGLRLDTAQADDLLQGIDANAVQYCFTVFRHYAASFPFINPNFGEDAVFMITVRPLTTIAICTVASAANPALQDRLNKAARLSLAAKAIVDCEQSLDLLLGLLTYLSWIHHYNDLDRSQIFQYLHLLAGMAVDQGFYQPSYLDGTEDRCGFVERDRALLGCYYLSASLSSTGFHRPTPLRWTESLYKLAENVAKHGTLPSDRTITSVIELAHTIEDFEELFQAPTHTPSFAIEMHAKAAHQRLKTLKREYPSLGSNPAFTASTIHIYSKLLTPTNPTNLIQCACTIKEYLDDILSRPSQTLHRLSIVDWSHLLGVLMLMARISKPFPNNAGGWEAGALTSMLPPEELLDSLCSRMAAAPAGDALAPRNESLVQWLRVFCGSVKGKVVRDSCGGRFRSMDDGRAVVSYGAEAGAISKGVLDQSFLHEFMRPS